jgi:uncharacterized membrane protein YcjF (UPF0283 family)
MPHVDPIVPVPIDGRAGLEMIAGTAANIALILTVAGLGIGWILIGAGVLTRHPGWSRRGWETVVGAIFCAILSVGMSAWVAWIGGEVLRIWH